MPIEDRAAAAPSKSSNTAKPKRRRQRGTGHVRPRGDRWVAVYRFPGRANAVQRTRATEEEAELLLREVELEKLKAKKENRLPVDPGGPPSAVVRIGREARTFSWLVEQYEQAHRSVDAGTWRNRRPILHKHLVPAFGDDPITAIDLSDLENYREDKVDPEAEMPIAVVVVDKEKNKTREERWCTTPLSATTVNHHISLLKLLFQWAVDQGYLAVSPAARLKRLKTDDDHTRRVPTPAESMRLLEAIEDPEKRDIAHTVARFGLRIGEALGLGLDPFSEEYPDVIYVDQAVHVLETGAVALGTPKTDAAKRLLPAAEWQKTVYATQVLRLADRHNPHGLLFPARNGEPRSPNNARRDILKPALKKAGLPEWWGWHDLRRGFITAAFVAGTDDKVIMAQAGHTDIRTTQRYNKVSTKRLMDEAFDPFAEVA